MSDGLKDLFNKLAKPPTKEEWELRQRQQIVQRRHQIARDLSELVKRHVVFNDTSVAEAIIVLGRAKPEDIPIE